MSTVGASSVFTADEDETAGVAVAETACETDGIFPEPEGPAAFVAVGVAVAAGGA